MASIFNEKITNIKTKFMRHFVLNLVLNDKLMKTLKQPLNQDQGIKTLTNFNIEELKNLISDLQLNPLEERKDEPSFIPANVQAKLSAELSKLDFSYVITDALKGCMSV